MNSQKLANFFNISNFEINEFENYVIHNLRIKFINSNIYYKPNINGDILDILIIEENKGVILIDICTFKLNEYIYTHYEHTKYKKFQQKTTKDFRLSPIEKLLNYKNNLFTIHIDGLLEEKSKNISAFSIIRNIVIFQYETVQSIYDFFNVNKIEYTKLLGKDNFLDIDLINQNKYFKKKAYNSFLQILSPQLHKIEDGIKLNYSKKQKYLSVSKEGQFKIRGVAGAGKTYILAKRAVNAHFRHSENILILTYNKSLKQYIRSKISEIEHDFDYKYFHIDNYHNFIKVIKNNLSIISENDFELVQDYLPKFKSIFIDEIQDFETEWIRIIKKYFLANNSELVVFGDEKQNLYDRELDENKKVNTTIPSRWNELKDSCRFNGKIIDLANSFQTNFLSKKYEIVEIKKQSIMSFKPEHIEYIKFDINSTLEELAYSIQLKIKNDKLNLKDISIVSSKNEFLQNLDFILRTKLQLSTHTIFEKKESIQQFKYNNQDIKDIRNFKKNKFNIYTNAIKLSTIKSFKGYEAKILFFLITENDMCDEEIYTAFTRASQNLYIINNGNIKYDEFFSKNIENPKNIQNKLTDEIKQSIDTYDDNETNRLKSIIKDLENKYKIQKETINKTKSENATLKLEIDNSLNEINQIGTIVKYSKEIENLLIKLGADKYLDFIDKIKFFESRLEDSIIHDLHEIRQYRNKVVHNTTVIYDFTYFIHKCKSMINILEKVDNK